MIISYNKNITKLKNNKTIGITITLQRLLQSTKHALSVDLGMTYLHSIFKGKCWALV